MQAIARSVSDYFVQAGERTVTLRTVDTIIRRHAPKLKRQLFNGGSYSMVAYGMFHYKSKSGREGDWPIIALANQKNYMSLYVCAIEDGQYLAEAYKNQLGKVSVGRSCIRFKKLSDLNLDVVAEICDKIAAMQQAGREDFLL